MDDENMQTNDNNDDNFMRKRETLEGFPEIRGYDFNEKFDFDKFISSYKSMGIQGTNLGYGIEIVNAMIEDKATIFLSCTSNMISSGNRDIIRFLVQHKNIHAISVSAGGVEEDVIKVLRPFVIGSFDMPGRTLFEKGIGRIGNIFAPDDRYSYFEKFTEGFFDRIYAEQKKRGTPFTPSELIYELGREMENLENKEESYIYWAYKNDVPVFCPGIMDGTIGNFLYSESLSKKEFYLDVIADHKKIVNMVLAAEKTGAILLGGGIAKHYVLDANIYRDGLDYAVYITTADEHDASDSGGNPQEAMSWAKIRINARNVKIKCEATIVFPLLVTATFAK
jgi:deoxyhypusine synthase